MTTTLPASWYGDPSIHERERRAVFGREWLFVGFAASLREPGDYIATDIAGWPVVVLVDDDAGLRAHHNVCRHRAGPLVPTATVGCRASCAATTDGRTRSTGNCARPETSASPSTARRWRCGQCGSTRGAVGFVNLDLDGVAPTLLDSLGNFVDACDEFPIESFVPGSESEHELACNWKTYADNYLEGYHIPLVHPALNKEIDAKRYRVDVDEGHRWVVHSAPARDGALNLGRWLWRWPNLAVNLYAEGMNVERYDPVGLARTRALLVPFADPDAPSNVETARSAR